MEEINQSINAGPIVMKKSIALAEIIGEGGDRLERNLHLLKRTQMMTIRQHRLEDLDLGGVSARDVIGLGHVVTQDQEGVVGMTHLKSQGDPDQIREKMNIDHQKDRRRRDDSPPPEKHEEDKSKDRSSQQSQLQVGHDQPKGRPLIATTSKGASGI